jgi:hypothetical protein
VFFLIVANIAPLRQLPIFAIHRDTYGDNFCRSPRRGAKLAGKQKRCHFCNPKYWIAKMASFLLTDLSLNPLRRAATL